MTTSRATETDVRAPKVLTTFRHPIEAEHLANQLRDHGVEVITAGSTIATGGVEFAQVDVEVLVPAEQLDMARSLMREFEAKGMTIDWDAIDWQADAAPASTDTSADTDSGSLAEDTVEATISRLLYPEPSPSIGNWFIASLVIGLCIWAAMLWFGP